ncbi:hypothetical protein RDABS01_008972 [Bienertia sinuspersici]
MSRKITAKMTNFIPSFMLFLFIIPTALSDLSSSRSALISLSSAVGGRTLLWNTSNINPCSWSGVMCKNDAVVGLHLPGFSLSGKIPNGVFKNLTSLKTLSLRYNLLSGNLPSDLGSCSELRNVYLQENEFDGEIPEFFSQLRNLVRLNLASNNFSGQVPVSLKNLTRLKTLYLQDNNLSGVLPELKLELDQFNVSNNRFNGSIPVSLSSMPVTAFQGNKLCGKPLQICPGIAAGTGILTGDERKKKKGLSGGAIAGIVIGAVVAFALILMIIVFICGKKKTKKRYDVPEEKPVGDTENGGGLGGGYSVSAAAAAAMATNGSAKLDEVGGGVNKKLVFFGHGVGGRLFDLEELLRASAEVLGKGTFGTAYKAVLEMGTVVAVKRLKDVILEEKEFKEKIEVVGAMDHEYLVPLRAYYFSRDEKLLVFDYMPTGSLSAFLHGNKGAGRTPLNWELRSSIALGVARGISYLHSQGPDFSHGNIKSSNVLLTKPTSPCFDFGLAQLVGPSSTPNRVSGYRAPEVIDSRKIPKSRCLQLRSPTLGALNRQSPNTRPLKRRRDDWASEVFDLELLRYQHAEEEMVHLLQLAVDCAAQYPDTRPSMLEVTNQIEKLCSTSSREASDPNSTSFADADEVSSH